MQNRTKNAKRGKEEEEKKNGKGEWRGLLLLCSDHGRGDKIKTKEKRFQEGGLTEKKRKLFK